MKKLQEKLALLLVILKGKKPVVVVISLVVIGLCLLGVNYGYITEDVLNFSLIVESVDSWFKTNPVDTLAPAVDTLTNVVDTSVVVIDTLVK
jgi:hypothetical protein